MKRLLSIFLILTIILCGCKKADEDIAVLQPEKEPVSDTHIIEPEYKKPIPAPEPKKPDPEQSSPPQPPKAEPLPPKTEPLPPKTEPQAPDFVYVPVLMYHHLSHSGEGTYTISIENFKAHLDALRDNGYSTISLSQLLNYAKNGEPLPEKPVIISFDDGYLSNYTIAFPILKERQMKAVIFAIGNTIGATNGDSSDTASRISYSQIYEMAQSGIETHSHTFDMHRAPISDTDPTRKGVDKLAHETDEEHLGALKEDFYLSVSSLRDNVGKDVFALSYPYGIYNDNSEAAAIASGIKMTFTSDVGVSIIKKNDMGSLRLIKRFAIDDCTAEQLIEKIRTVY